ncbi:hypothetical protein DYB32_008086 [Aphanomyces invadans]|uniref:Polynucleotide kinase 3'-phosphatase n=1 Tax=Aphanomyces invadans TaxID=157072 RepID=A0A418ALZ5_9STRA|nr:hypothetical protein DYB32_008086 [Aphanomyces invadans]
MDKFVTKTAKRPAADDGRDTSTAKKAKSVERPESPAVGECTWEEIGTVLYMCNFAAPSCGTKTLAKIAALDLDSTLISTKSGKTFPTDAKDWKFWNECVPTALRNVVADGYQVVVFSNQSGLSKGRVSATELKTKINAIAAQLNMPLRVFLMSSDDIMRKPRIGAWTLMDMLSQGKSVVIDNTNRDIKVVPPIISPPALVVASAMDLHRDSIRRKRRAIALADVLLTCRVNVPVRAFYLDLPKALVFHLKEFRMLTSSDASKPTVPDMVIHGFFKNVQVPTVAEGFASVVHVPFVPLPHLVAEPSASFVEQDKALLTSFLLG